MKKGFTLIELLAVIVILVIVTLITTPIILNVVEDSRKNSAIGSAVGYLESLEEAMVTEELLSGKTIERERIYKVEEDTEYEYSELEYLNEHPDFNKEASNIYLNNVVNIKGTKPTDGYIIIGKQDVEEAELVINGYSVYCDSSRRCVVTGKFTSSSNVISIKIEEPNSYSIVVGNTLELKASVETIDGSESRVTWTSSDTSVATINSKGVITGIKEGQVTIIAKSGNKKSRITVTIINDSLLGYLSDANLKNDTIINMPVNGENYPAHVYVYNGDTTFSENMTFGDENDVATENGYAQNMVIVKVNGNLTINEGVTVNPYYTEYGGPKGFTIYVTGKLINNGTIDNSHGAKAEGQNVYLWKNSDGTYEYVPAEGGIKNTSGENRKTGGGGTGGYGSNPGDGASGTSYSGGTGGVSTCGSSGTANGGVGGSAISCGIVAPGGAGNPGGTGIGSKSGENGTGGLLIIYSDNYENKGTISASGSNGGIYNSVIGGGSGGGSINIFTNQNTGIDQLGIITDTRYNEILGTTLYAGGKANAGSGTVNVGEIRNGKYYDLKEIIEQDKESYRKSLIINGDSILSILKENNLKNGYYYLSANGENYPAHVYVYNGDTTFSENMTFGDENDVATENGYAQNMVIVKVNGNLTINEGVTVNPYYTEYGGPKGFTIYVTGKLINNGTIDNSHGAKAEGQNVYLWKNSDGTYEYVPAEGGIKNTSGENRKTGGGGTGGYGSNPGDGASGTSYSGGTGGVSTCGSSGTANGGVGGSAISCGIVAPGGAGNPGGTGIGSKSGENGTGGLLIIYSDNYENKGTISASGSNGGIYNSVIGGGSGGGSINIFTNQNTGIDQLGIITDTRYNEILGTTLYAGGKANAGSGTVNVGEIRNGKYYDLKEIIEQDKESYRKSLIINGDSILSILKENNLKNGYYYLSANGENYPAHVYVYNGDTTFSENMTFGDENDVATENGYAQNMVIVKVNGNLTINEGVTVNPYYTEYGGPKGFTIYVTGKLINNGTIDNSHGAKAEGQNVYLWKNSDGTYEYVPAEGGIKNTSGENRKTGGGGTGGYGSNPGDGASGTSYSGGTGGVSTCGSSGTANGGVGGSAISCGIVAPGGAGNPGGTGIGSKSGENGTGGLLIIYSDNYENKGTISASGSNGGIYNSVIGGGSGGGSINIFTNQNTGIDQLGIITDTRYNEILGTTLYAGGKANAGSGTINIGEIRNGKYYDLKEIIEQDKENYS